VDSYWFAFIAFAAVAFRQFSYRWLRVIAAFFAFLLLPLVPMVALAWSALPIDWILRLPVLLTIVAHLVELGIAGIIYV
jgi:hypothetical protein